ncbi:glycosyltransferase family 4 protein [Flavihumibacter fluvii]|uniref:glycosyltransferase family 4 protein n=1 Tax=Flavihumibacter fluvii TaxID=2838157 RepID=UPI001BDF1940|nr:glycosyltransferase family 4 protein [Flavihumibacter fluvii]ULQ54564.1 glycosyltransferase family 4 protein [Flavihumibacter fluvii]
MSPSPLNLIAFVSNNSWSVYNFRLPVIHYLQQQGYTVLVIAPDDAYSQLLVQEGCIYAPVNFNNRSASPIADLRYYRQLKKIYAQYRPAMVFHFVAKPNIYGSMAAGALGIPSVAVITGLGYAFDRRNWLHVLVKALYKISLNKASETWFLNAEDAAIFIREKLVPENKTRVLPGEGVDTGYFKRTTAAVQTGGKEFIFLMSCRLLKSKGIAMYAAAAGILRNKGYHFQCRLIGDYESRHPDNIHPAELEQWQKEKRISYLGFTNDVRPFLQEADCCVLPSYYHEGVPRSLMEAASMELPIITTNSQGCRELVLENVSGYLCRTKDAADLAAKMEMMLHLTQADRKAMGVQGRALMVRKFDTRHVIRFYEAAIRQFAGKQRP